MKTFSGQPISDNLYEIGSFINMLNKRGSHRFLAVGAGNGDTFYAVLNSLPFGAQGVVHSQQEHREQVELAAQTLTQNGRPASTLYGPSTALGTRALAYGRGPFDAALLSEPSTEEWKFYREAAPVIGILGIGGAVSGLWASIKYEGLMTFEYTAVGSKIGIGCVWPSIHYRRDK